MDAVHPDNLDDPLGKLLSVAEPELGNLGVQEFLGELLERVRTALVADTAAILLLDSASQTLVATASRGIEEEVYQGVRVPVGTGFAGTVAKRLEPVALDRVDETTVSNPILWEKGIKTMLGVPLGAPDGLIGVLHVGRLTSKGFSAQDIGLMEVVAERIAGAVRARRLETERSAAQLLEQSLMPTALPKVPGLAVATRYVTAERDVGGDWYDVFALPSGDVWIVVGDVSGHGLQAAAMMGRSRSTVRSYIMLGLPPGEVLQLTDRKIQQFEPGVMITVVCARARPPFGDFVMASAGHPPPVLAPPGGPNALVDLPVGPPIGVSIPDKAYRTVSVELPAMAVLGLYSDGLVERPRESLDVGLERLLSSFSAEEPELVCQRAMRRLIGSEAPRDDVVLVTLRRNWEWADQE